MLPSVEREELYPGDRSDIIDFSLPGHEGTPWAKAGVRLKASDGASVPMGGQFRNGGTCGR